MYNGRKIRVLEGIRQGKIGGGESYLLGLVSHLDKSRFEPVVLSFTNGPMVEQLRAQGISTHVIHTERPFDWRVWRQVAALIQSEEIDLVHAHGTRAHSNLFWAARKAHVPILYTCHAWSFHPDQNALVRKIRIWSEEFLTSRSDLTICVSHANRETGRKLFRNFNAEVIDQSIDPERFDPLSPRKDVRKELGIGKEETVVVSVARFTLQKQPLKLIRSFAAVARSLENVRLLMVGDGEQRPEALALVRELGLEQRVILEPFRLDIPDVLAAADIFVLPSLWEGSPIALLEAMSMGKAVIGTAVEGTSEIIRDGVNGLLIRPEDLEQQLEAAIGRLCVDRELRERLGEQAMASVSEKHHVRTVARRNEELYLRYGAGHRTRGRAMDRAGGYANSGAI
jgi:glycosyltransferase involved in cell wall biosynthesis